jgi:hypothetical protein
MLGGFIADLRVKATASFKDSTAMPPEILSLHPNTWGKSNMAILFTYFARR